MFKKGQQKWPNGQIISLLAIHFKKGQMATMEGRICHLGIIEAERENFHLGNK